MKNGKFTYPKVGHKPGATYQYELLEAHALRVGSQPVHLFYNGWPTGSVGAPVPPAGFDYDLHGCAAVMTPVVHEVRDRTSRPHGASTRASIQATDYLTESVPWSELFKRLDPPPRQPRRQPGPDGTVGTEIVRRPDRPDGAGGDDGGISNGPRDPSGPPHRPISVTKRDLVALEKRVAELSGEYYEPRVATKLPDYVTQARGKARSQLPRDSDLPLFALVVEVN